jgi:glycosyltransferase involved in cell wall biosynthesis
MKIFGTCLIKNEADIIEETLEHAVTWCDVIIVDDNGSTDGTWEIVQRMAKRYPQIIPWRQKALPYSEALRGDPFRAYRHLSSDGDWWAKLDSDERYIDEPRAFLASVPRGHHVVVAAQCQYQFTEKDLADWQLWEHSGAQTPPAHERLHFYRCDWAEIRFFRYRSRLVWPESSSWPVHMGVMHPRRIRNRHLQYRAPQQMQLRLDTRQQAIREGALTFDHQRETHDWQQLVVDSGTCDDDRAPGGWRIDESKLPRLREKPLYRLIKQVMHGTGIWA